MNKELRIDVYSHNFMVSEVSPRAKVIVRDFCLSLGELEIVKKARWEKSRNQMSYYYEKTLKRIYAAATADRKEYRFHINSYKEFLKRLAYGGLHEEHIDIIKHPCHHGVKVEYDLIDKREPREEDQVPAIEYLSSSAHSKVLTLQTGKGKTMCANRAINNISERTVIIIKGMYVQRWLDDLNECFKFKKGELMVVRGSKDLITLIELAKANLLDAKVIIITNTTYRMFIDDYEVNRSANMYDCDPIDFFSLVGAGIRLIDEVHQDFHLNFKIDLYTNIKTTINLSATLKSDNLFLNTMYDLMFPITTRPDDFGFDKYINVKAYIYYLLEPRKINHKQRGRTSYSHVAFEESVMRSKTTMKNYFFMIADIILKTFVSEYKSGQKIIVFCATVEMCTRLTEYLKNMFPDYDVNRYVAEDNYSIMGESDIIVSTLKSAGTAVDIPDLKMALLTTAIGSRQSNEQAVGRLRKLKRWPDIDPEFIYLVCQDIESHLVYHLHKQEVLSDKISSFKEYITEYKV